MRTKPGLYVIFVVAVLAASLNQGCGGRPTLHEVIPNVQRILMQDEDTYSLVIPSGKPNEYKMKVIHGFSQIRFVTDVPEDKACWAEITSEYTDFWGGYRETVTLHLHKIKEVEGGGWNHGKHGHGQTQVIE